MSAKGTFLILRRFRAGDEDLILKTYGVCGISKLYLEEGLLPERGYLGKVEPFNVLNAVYKQSGSMLILKEIIRVQPLSYLTLEDYSSYEWMNAVANFVEKWFFHYDPELFELAVNYLTLRPKNIPTFILRFKLEFLRRMGIYKEEAFKEDIRNIVVSILKEESAIKLERLKLSNSIVKKLEEAIQSHLSLLL
ncbi:MAG: hypothetical protein NZ526_02280 [Aquificaceae bacterium]|nr:hypothetical protein [Aquificaceae bacterium]